MNSAEMHKTQTFYRTFIVIYIGNFIFIRQILYVLKFLAR